MKKVLSTNQGAVAIREVRDGLLVHLDVVDITALPPLGQPAFITRRDTFLVRPGDANFAYWSQLLKAPTQ